MGGRRKTKTNFAWQIPCKKIAPEVVTKKINKLPESPKTFFVNQITIRFEFSPKRMNKTWGNSSKRDIQMSYSPNSNLRVFHIKMLKFKSCLVKLQRKTKHSLIRQDTIPPPSTPSRA